MPTTTRRHVLTLAGLEVPVIELTGAADGPRLTVIAGVHGCEYASMDGVRKWARRLSEIFDAGCTVPGNTFDHVCSTGSFSSNA